MEIQPTDNDDHHLNSVVSSHDTSSENLGFLLYRHVADGGKNYGRQSSLCKARPEMVTIKTFPIRLMMGGPKESSAP